MVAMATSTEHSLLAKVDANSVIEERRVEAVSGSQQKGQIRPEKWFHLSVCSAASKFLYIIDLQD